jgi:hypothetical protein
MSDPLSGCDVPLTECHFPLSKGNAKKNAPFALFSGYVVTIFVFIVELSGITHPIRGNVLRTMPAEHLFSLARRLCGTDQRAEAPENSFE